MQTRDGKIKIQNDKDSTAERRMKRRNKQRGEMTCDAMNARREGKRTLIVTEQGVWTTY